MVVQEINNGGFLTFSPTWNLMIKTLSIGRMDNFIILRRFSRMAILVQMLSFRDKLKRKKVKKRERF